MAMWMPLLSSAWQTKVETEHVRAELLVHAPKGLGAGQQARLGLSIAHKSGWHTYWKNPGDSGLATSLNWTLPPGFSAGPIQWPIPKQLPLGPLMNYGYVGKVLLPVALTVPPGHRAGPVEIRLQAEWLVCKDICLPESGNFSIKLDAGETYANNAPAFDLALSRIPPPVPQVTARARVDNNVMSIDILGLPAAMRDQPLQFFPEEEGVFEHAAQPVARWEGAQLRLAVPLATQRSESPARLHFVLAHAGGKAGMRIAASVEGAWSAPGVSQAPQVAAAPNALLLMLLLAFTGGVLLNLMPCVFPVLAMKVFSFASLAHERARVVGGGFAYFAGVVLTFLALGGVLLALRSAGAQLGWGFQLQSPLFVAALAALFALIGLNLAGAFELGSVLPDRLVALRARNQVIDDFLSGVLAVAVASPCTGPFLGAALGASLTQPPAEALALFATVGAGMASPYLAASLVPGVARLLPRPGAWMVRFKVIMAFPMFGTVVWLMWVLGQQVGIDGAVAMLGFLVALAFAVWTITTPAQARARTILAGCGAALLAGVSLWAWPALRSPEVGTASVGSTSRQAWQQWTPAAVKAAQISGRPVFVDFTAAWCVTCQFNKRVTLADSSLLAEFESKNVLLLRADWTRRDPAITAQLSLLGRSGVPVYALYGKGGEHPRLLSELLTAAEVKTALDQL